MSIADPPPGLEDTEPEVESDLRRRAAWLLVMLAVAAVLLIVIISAVASSDKSGKSGNGAGPGPLDSQARQSTSHSHSSAARSSSHSHPHSSTPSDSGAATGSAGSGGGQVHCPSRAACIVDGDIGNGVAAINAYRTQHGQPAVPGAVSAQAQDCAVHNGAGCTGGWAETELSQPDGAAAVQKILKFAHLLDPHLKSVEVGWAYDPKAKLYYFAIVRDD